MPTGKNSRGEWVTSESVLRKALRLPERCVMKEERNPSYRYGCWAGKPDGYPQDPKKCVEEVHDKFRFHQCSRKRGHGPGGLYCAAHAAKQPDQEIKTGFRVFGWDIDSVDYVKQTAQFIWVKSGTTIIKTTKGAKFTGTFVDTEEEAVNLARHNLDQKIEEAEAKLYYAKAAREEFDKRYPS